MCDISSTIFTYLLTCTVSCASSPELPLSLYRPDGSLATNGGFSEAPQPPLEGTVLPAHLRQRPDPRAGIIDPRDGLRHLRPEMEELAIFTPYRPPRPEKSEGGKSLTASCPNSTPGDQPQAIAELVEGVSAAERDQVLLGVTGSGKTFTMAKVIEQMQRPALVLAPNKTLAAQLYGEFKSSSPTTRSNISSPITITISPKPTCRAPTPTSRRNPRSTSRSTGCATRRRARCSSATTSSSSPRSPASTASAMSRPIRP